MLMKVDCSEVVSLNIKLTFDDASIKERTFGVGDIIDVEFNQNGCRKIAVGKVIKICTSGADPRTWMIMIDCSDDFSSVQYKFSPMAILNLEVIKHHDAIKYIETPTNYSNIASLCIIDNQLQYTQDGVTWLPVKIDSSNVIQPESEDEDPEET